MKLRRLAVLLAGEAVAVVERTSAGVLRLTYTATTPVPLSLSLPAEVPVHSGVRVDRWLRALLPDSEAALVAIERQYGSDRRDPLSLLDAVGKDCAGAVQFCPPGEVEATMERAGGLLPAPDHDIEARLSMIGVDEDASWTLPGEHWSLGGTQQKFTLRREAGTWFYPAGSEPSTHIVKPGIRRLRSQALVEHLSMSVARRVGVDAAATRYLSFGSEDALVVTRFDRAVDADGTVIRLHQEDMCQALGVEEKYEEYGGPSAGDLVRLLRDQSHTAAAARRSVARFVDGIILNAVLGASDAHARNYAVMLGPDGPTLAPLFDVASGLAYLTPAASRRLLSMSIGGEYDLDRIGAEQWRRFADQVKLDPAEILARVEQFAIAVPDAFRAELDAVGGSVEAEELRERLLPALAANADRVANTAV